MPRAASHLETDVLILQRSLSRVQSLYRQSMPSQFAQLAPRGSGREPREKLVHGARERQEARTARGVIHDPHAQTHFRDPAPLGRIDHFTRRRKITQEMTSLCGSFGWSHFRPLLWHRSEHSLAQRQRWSRERDISCIIIV